MDGKVLNSILVKPAGPDCNLTCEYCFYSAKSSLFPGTMKHRMIEATLTEMIKQAMGQAGETIGIAWQGGEPTLMGLQFFQKSMDLIRRYGKDQTVGNALQTNGLLIDKDWIRFLNEYNFLVGLSIDGPKHVHDHYRRTKNGRSTWSRVADKAKMMLNGGVSVNALSVVTDYSSEFPEESYSFLKDLGLTYMQFIPCVERDPMKPGEFFTFSVSAEKYGAFLCKLFDLWLADFVNGCQTTSIRFFDSVFDRYVGLTPPECTLLEECGNYLVVEHNGDVYCCDFFVEPNWKLGNIQNGRLHDMLNSNRQTIFGARKKQLLEECKACKWLYNCQAGCIKDRVNGLGHIGTNHLCAAFKMFFDHADPKLRQLAESWKALHSSFPTFENPI